MLPAHLLRTLRTPIGAGLTLAVSLLSYVVITLRGAEPFGMVDLRVYWEGAHHLWDDTTLYTFAASPLGLPFTYPPFAAVLFSAFAWLPWTASRLLWQLTSIAAIAVICHLSLRLVENPADRRPVNEQRCLTTLLTAAAIWMEPVRGTLNYGQVNLYLAAALLGGLATRRSWAAGVTVGLCTAIKLVPGITALYYLLAARGRVVTAAAITGVFTVAVSVLAAPDTTRQFLTSIMVDAARAGTVEAVNNQSLRGALARIWHHDNPWLWAFGIAVTVAVAALSARACLKAGDHLGAFIVIQLAGLLVSPISWNHHWVWVLPLIIWAEHGPLRHHRAINTVSTLWQLLVFSFAVSIQVGQATTVSGYAALGLALYPTMGVATILAIWVTHRGTATVPAGRVVEPVVCVNGRSWTAHISDPR